jgi:hypothetical protein
VSVRAPGRQSAYLPDQLQMCSVTGLVDYFNAVASCVVSVSRDLPSAPLEPTNISAHSVTDSYFDLGRVRAPSAVTADFVDLSNLQSYASANRSFSFRVSLSSAYMVEGPEDAYAAIESLVHHLHVDAVLLTPDTDATRPLSLEVRYVPQASCRCVTALVTIPHRTPHSSKIVVNSVYVAGSAVTASHAQLPFTAVVCQGLLPLLRLPAPRFKLYTLLTPAVSGSGRVFVPQIDSAETLVFGYDGIALPSVDLEPLGLSTSVTIVTGVCDLTNTLILADMVEPTGRIAGIDVETHTLRWSAPAAGCRGIAVLSERGVFIAAFHATSSLHVYRIADGALLSTSSKLPGMPVYAAADPITSTVFVSVGVQVHAYKWDGNMLLSQGVVKESEPGENYRALAWIPPSDSSPLSYLVVGTWGTSEVMVLSLPDCKLIARISLRRPPESQRAGLSLTVKGLAADPTGSSLVVCDNDDGVYVLPWPLAGM